MKDFCGNRRRIMIGPARHVTVTTSQRPKPGHGGPGVLVTAWSGPRAPGPGPVSLKINTPSRLGHTGTLRLALIIQVIRVMPVMIIIIH